VAEPWKVAFGRYLKILRGRCAYSLDDVGSLSQTFPDPITKSYLSRCENGLQRLALSKLIPLSRIYDVPSEVLIERMELDMELDRVGGPETAGMELDDLYVAGRSSLDEGYVWAAYGFFRDAIIRANSGSVSDRHSSRTEQVLMSYVNCGVAGRVLGRNLFALHELKFVRRVKGLPTTKGPLLLLLFSQCHRNLGDLNLARVTAEQAVRGAERAGDARLLAHALSTSGNLAVAQDKPSIAVSHFQRSFKLLRGLGEDALCATLLNNLAQAFFDLRRYRAARRSAIAAQRFGRELGQHRALALSRILLGEIAALDSHSTRAVAHWKQAAGLATKVDDKILRFKAEFFLFRQATMEGNLPAVRVYRRRLTRLSPWVPANTWELAEFRRLAV